MNRGQVLYRVAELMEGRRDQFVAEVAAAEGLRGGEGARGRRPGDRPLGLVRRLGRQDRPGPRLVEPGRRAVLQLHDPRADRRRRRSSRRRRRRCSGSCRGWRRRSSRATPSSSSRRETRPLPAVTLTEVLATSDVPGGVVNVLTGLKTELVPVLAGHVDVDALDVWGVPADLRTEVELVAADNIKRIARRPAGVDRREVRLARRPRRGAPRVDRGLPRDEDRLAPDRDLSPPHSTPAQVISPDDCSIEFMAAGGLEIGRRLPDRLSSRHIGLDPAADLIQKLPVHG